MVLAGQVGQVVSFSTLLFGALGSVDILPQLHSMVVNEYMPKNKVWLGFFIFSRVHATYPTTTSFYRVCSE